MAKFGILDPKLAAKSEHTTKWAPLGRLTPSIPRPTRRVRAHVPINQTTTVTLSVRGCLGGRLARGVQESPVEGRPIRFVPSLLLLGQHRSHCTIRLVQNV
jgi:hypothetical protein